MDDGVVEVEVGGGWNPDAMRGTDGVMSGLLTAAVFCAKEDAVGEGSLTVIEPESGRKLFCLRNALR